MANYYDVTTERYVYKMGISKNNMDLVPKISYILKGHSWVHIKLHLRQYIETLHLNRTAMNNLSIHMKNREKAKKDEKGKDENAMNRY